MGPSASALLCATRLAHANLRCMPSLGRRVEPPRVQELALHYREEALRHCVVALGQRYPADGLRARTRPPRIYIVLAGTQPGGEIGMATNRIAAPYRYGEYLPCCLEQGIRHPAMVTAGSATAARSGKSSVSAPNCACRGATACRANGGRGPRAKPEFCEGRSEGKVSPDEVRSRTLGRTARARRRRTVVLNEP